jgi:hypothetical protein
VVIGSGIGGELALFSINSNALPSQHHMTSPAEAPSQQALFDQLSGLTLAIARHAAHKLSLCTATAWLSHQLTTHGIHLQSVGSAEHTTPVPRQLSQHLSSCKHKACHTSVKLLIVEIT